MHKNYRKILALLMIFAMILQYSVTANLDSVYAGDEKDQAEVTQTEEAESEPDTEPAPEEDVEASSPAVEAVPAAEEEPEPAEPEPEEVAEESAPAEQAAPEPEPEAARDTAAEAEEAPEPDVSPESVDETSSVEEEPAEEEVKAEAAESEEKKAEEEEEPEEETEYPAQNFSGRAGGVSVSISAPEGALPEGTVMSVTAVSSDSVQAAVEDVIGAGAGAIKAVDITFSCDGSDIEPKKAVSVSISASGLANEGNQSVVHIADNGDASLVTGDVSGGSAAFRTSDFSIYLVVEEDVLPEDENAVATYEFYVEEELVMTQYIKTGDKITDPGTSVVNADDANTVFKGWFIGDEEVDFDSEQTVDTTETIRVDAKIQHTYYVTFWGEADTNGDRGIVAVKSVTVEGSESGTVDIDDVSVTPKSDISAFKGWSEESEGTSVIDGSSIEVSGRKDLYAVVVDAHWLHFYENVGEDSDSDATYTGPVFIAEDEVRSSKKPDDPTRKGYEFGGWYLDEDCTSEFDWTETGLEEDTNLYAKWIPGEAEFTIIVWKQKITDSKDAADGDKTYDYELSAPWTGETGEVIDLSNFSMYEDLDFTGFHYNRMEASPETVKADGSSVVNVYYDRNLLTIRFLDGTHTEYEPTTGNQGTQYGLIDGEYIALTRSGNGWTYQVSHEYTGTTYRTVNNNNGTQYGFVNGQMVQLTRAGRGTFLNPYYWTYNGQRYYGTRYATPANGDSGFGFLNGAVIGISNQDGKWIYTTNETYTGTRYRAVQEPTATEYTGLYGQTLTQNGYTWPGERAWYQNPNASGTRLTFLDAFKFEGLSGTSENDTILTQYGANQSGDNYVRFYKQNINGNWPANDSPTDRIRSTGNGTFTITEKYEGFKAVSYAHGGGWTNGGAGTSTSVNNLQIRFERQKFTLTLMSESEQFDTVSEIPYEDTMSKYKPANEPSKEHYDFVGWFEDPTGQTEFDWGSTMPAANKVIYAKFEPKQYHVSLDPNGGEFQNAQVGEFNVPLDTILDKTSLFQNVALEGHELIGWFDTTTGSAYGFGKIEEDVSLIAKWRYPGQVQIVYDAGDHGDGAPEDNFKYATDSSVVLGAPPTTVEEGYAFVGWSVGGKKYYTNNTFTINDDIIENYDEATKTGTVTITAIYQKLDEGALTPTTITYDPNGGTGTAITVSTGSGPDGKLLVNEPVVSMTIEDAGFTREGYEFDGWNTDPDGDGLAVEAGVDIAGDLRNLEKNTDINTLYAQWVEVVELSYNSNGGSGTMDPQTGRAGSEVTVADNGFTWTGHEFTGWNTKADGSGTDYAEGAPYNLGDEDSVLYAQWESSTKEVSVRINGNRVEKPYNGEYQDGDPYTLTWFVDGEEVSEAPEGVSFKNTSGIDCPNGKDAMEYKASIEGEIIITDTSKYTAGEVTVDEEFEGVTYLVITPLPITIELTGNNDTVEYDGRDHIASGLTFEVSGLLDVDADLQITISGQSAASVSGRNIGNYPMNMKAEDYRAILPAGNNNYTIAEDAITVAEDGWLEIIPASITIKITGNTKTAEYTGTSQTVEGYTAECDSALYDEDNISYKGPVAALGKNVKKYPIGLDGETAEFTYDDPNVEATFDITDGWLEITPVELAITTGTDSKTYDGTELTNEEVTAEGLAEPDVDKVTITANGSQTDAGSSDNTYSIVWEDEELEANYTITDQLGTLTVEAAEITVTTGSAEKVYDGEALSSDEATITGLADADKDKVTIKATGTQTEVGSSDNTYEIDWGDVNKDNYTIKEELGKLTVTEEPTPEPVKHKVTYKYTGTVPAGAPEVPAEAEYETGETVTVADEPALDGYVFSGWSKTGSFDMPDEDVEITGSWTAAEAEADEFTITYDLNGGEYDGSTEDITETYEKGTVISIHEAPTREGYEFEYWKGSKYLPGEEYTVEEDHTFVAQWSAIDDDDDDDDDDGDDPGEPDDSDDPSDPSDPSDQDDQDGPDDSGEQDDSDNSNLVRTGDDTNLPGAVGGFFVSLAALVGVIFLRRRNDRDDA